MAPLLSSHHPHGTVNDSYIIMLKDDLAPSLKENHFNFLQMAHQADPLLVDGGVRHVYSHVSGYAGRFTEGVIDQIRSMPEVDYVEKDQIVRTTDVQKGAPWVGVMSYAQSYDSNALIGSRSYKPSAQAHF
jgi:cerevisin